MIFLKMKKFLYLFITLAVVGALVTSCEKEAIQEDTIELKTLIESEVSIQDTEQLQFRGVNCNNLVAEADVALKNLVTSIKNFNGNQTSTNKTRVIQKYDFYRLYVLEDCLSLPISVPILDPNDVQSSCGLGSQPCSGLGVANTLEWFVCRLVRYLDNPTNGKYNDVKSGFNFYIGRLNNCLLDDFGLPPVTVVF